MALALYDLADSYKGLVELLETDGIDSEVIVTALEQVKGALEEKATNIATIIRMMDYDADIIKAEEKRLADRRKAIENKRDGIKRYLQSQMEKAKLTNIKTPTTTLFIKNNPPALKISNENLIPAKYMTIIPEQKIPNNEAIKKALKDGEAVPGAELTRGKSLQIK